MDSAHLLVRWRSPQRSGELPALPTPWADAPFAWLAGLAPGDHVIEVEVVTHDGERHAAAPVTVQVRAGETVRSTVDLEAAVGEVKR